jgi:ERCC4-related helicase
MNMMGSFFQRTAVLQNLCHAKQLLMTQGTESFSEYFAKVFALEKKDQKKIGFLKQCKQSQEYQKVKEYIDESLQMANHPKLRKLAELLTLFFQDPKHEKSSKVIVFTQYRESAKEIKRFLDAKI